MSKLVEIKMRHFNKKQKSFQAGPERNAVPKVVRCGTEGKTIRYNGIIV